MDRFIASAQYKETNGDVILKSNMDRFIVQALRQLCIDRDF